MFGLPTAINAGNAAYFLSELFTNRIPNLPLATRVAIYEQYFVALRAAHAGQGLDIRGLTDLVPAAVESGDVAALLNAILAIHRLKSGAPVAALARIGARFFFPLVN